MNGAVCASAGREDDGADVGKGKRLVLVARFRAQHGRADALRADSYKWCA